MIRRTVLAVLVAAALAAAAAPAIDHARVERADGAVATDVDALEAAARSLAGDEAVPAGREGARRTVEFGVASDDWDVARVDAVRIENESARTLAVAYRIGGGRERTRRIAAPVPIRTAESDGIALDGAESHSLALSLRGGERRRIVVDRRER